MRCIDVGKRKLKILWNWIKNVVGECQKSLRSFFKFPQAWLAISVLVVCLSGYFLCCDIRFFEFLVIVIVIPALAYAFGSYYYTSAVITAKPECFQDEAQKLESKALKGKELYVHSDGKVYSIKKEFPQLKIYFSRKGKHSVYLYDENGMVGDGPQKANTYEHHIAYVEFNKNNKSDEQDTAPKAEN